MGWSSLAGAGISGITSLLGANEVSDAAQQAAAYQQAAGQQAAGLYPGTQAANANALSPYTNTGSMAAQTLGNQLSTLAAYAPTPGTRYVDSSQTQIDPSKYTLSADPYRTSTSISQADLQNTPGYEFTLAQGLKAAQSSAAARGLGVSGAALKGAATYATGLSDQTYDTRFQQQMGANAQNFGQAATANQDNFNNALSGYGQNFTQKLAAANQNFGQDQSVFADRQANQNNAYNKLYGAAGLGQQAATTVANSNNFSTQGQANALLGVGNAQAAASNASGQAYGSAVAGIGGALNNGINQYNAYGLIGGALNNQSNGSGGSLNLFPSTAGNANTFGNALSGYLSKGLFS